MSGTGNLEKAWHEDAAWASCRWTTEQAAAYLGLAPKTLRNSRVKAGAISIPYLKLGSRVVYRSEDVIAFAEARLRKSTSDRGEQS